MPTDLQSVPFDRFGIHPMDCGDSLLIFRGFCKTGSFYEKMKNIRIVTHGFLGHFAALAAVQDVVERKRKEYSHNQGKYELDRSTLLWGDSRASYVSLGVF